MTDTAVMDVLHGGVGQAYPSAAAVVMRGGDVVFEGAAGEVYPGQSATLETVYDLASLTKPIATCSVLWSAICEGRVHLSDSVGPRLFPEQSLWSHVTVRHLVGHASGLPAWSDLAGDWNTLASMQFDHPPGAQVVYSDLGYIALGRYLELVLEAPLDELLLQVSSEFGLRTATFTPTKAAPTERTVKRGLIVDEVHDPNAYALGGVCGHAGLFATVLDVAVWGNSVLRKLYSSTTAIGAVINTCWDETAGIADSSWRLGLDSVTPGKSSAGRFFGPRARGHLGYTGTSIWMEPDQDVVVALLTNRVHPTDHANPEIKRFRPRFHDVVATTYFR